MARKIYSDPVAFSRLSTSVTKYQATGRTTSAAFLLWFLQTIYRLDEIEAQDAVCDGTLDLGIDALVVEDEQREIVLFQAKWKEKLPSTLGDTDLKKFVGTRANVANRKIVEDIISNTKNDDLRNLLKTHGVPAKVEQGYKLHTIFIANVAADTAGSDYIRHAETADMPLDVWDLHRLAPVLEQLAATGWFVSESCKLKLSANKFFVDGPKTDPHLVFGAVPAVEFVRMPGINDTRIFAQNVRLFLDRTRVNEEIKDSVKNKKEHGGFLTFHNGLTIVARNLSVGGNTLTMSDYSVCNGCQSLETFFNNRQMLTPNLEVIVRFVRVDSKQADVDRDLAASIAYRTNNQNPVSLRDQSANDSTQVHLKADFDQYFGEGSTYGIKRGAPSTAPELPNEYAGQLLLALYTREPWNSHQKYRIFGNLYGEIFRYGISASHIRLAQLMAEKVTIALGGISNERVRKYGLTRFVVLYLVGECLRQEADGVKLLEEPLPYLRIRGGAGETRQKQMLDAVEKLARNVVIELNYYLKDKGDSYDYKNEFKSPKALTEVKNKILKEYDKDKLLGRAVVFQLPS